MPTVELPTMPVTFHAEDDLGCCDGLETVTVQLPADGAAVRVVGALRRGDQHGEAAPSGGAYTATDVRWHLPADQLGAEPAVGAVIADAGGVRYVVQSVARSALVATWVCRARSLAIVSGLDQTVALQQGTWAKGPSGAQVVAWHDVRIALAARIQPEQGNIEIEYDRRLTRVTHRIYFADQIAVDHTYRIMAGSAAYRILGFEGAERIDSLSVILAEQVTAAPDEQSQP